MQASHVEDPELVVAFRSLLLWFVALILFEMLGTIVGQALGGTPPFFVVTIFTLIPLVAVMLYAYRTAEATGSEVPLLWAIAVPIPVLGLIALALLSSRASRLLKQQAVPVGLLGPRASAVEAARAQLAGHG